MLFANDRGGMVLVTKDSGKIAQPILALLLLVLGINTDDHYAALAANDLALLADRLYRRSYLHDILPPFLIVRNGGRDAEARQPLAPKVTGTPPLAFHRRALTWSAR